MKKFILFLSFILSQCWLTAQITFTNAGFPETGDTLKTAVDFAPSNIVVTAAGGPYDWDYSSLNAGILGKDYYLDASEGSIFDEVPTATHVVFNEQNTSESYYKISPEKVEFIGALGNDPTGFGLGAFLRFTPPVVERRAPLGFPATNSAETNVFLALAWDDLPTLLTDSLMLPFAPDSIRLGINATRDDFVDAYGSVTIPGGTYEVLREKRTQYSETIVEVLLPFIGWSDVTDLLPFEGLGADTTITYEFFSNDAKEVIVSLTVDADDNVISATFKDNGNLTSDEEVALEQSQVLLNPNPVRNRANFEFIKFPASDYQLSITGLQGNTVLRHSFSLYGHQTELLDLSHLTNGVYFYYLKNTQGEIVYKGKLVKQ